MHDIQSCTTSKETVHGAKIIIVIINSSKPSFMQFFKRFCFVLGFGLVLLDLVLFFGLVWFSYVPWVDVVIVILWGDGCITKTMAMRLMRLGSNPVEISIMLMTAFKTKLTNFQKKNKIV